MLRQVLAGALRFPLTNVIAGEGSSSPPVAGAVYVTEDGAAAYVTEDELATYVTETA